MSGIIGDIKKLFKFKFKARSDSATDQFHRLFMTRALLVGAFLTGLTWYKDEIKCVIPKSFGGSIDGFGPKSCWINGFYVYKELKDVQNYQGYYGLPDKMGHNGTETLTGSDGAPITCTSTPDNINNCKPMTKLFYLQYQWFPFYMAALALLYYLPYIMHQFVNTDLLSFKKDVKTSSVEDIAKNYFNRETNTSSRQSMRVLLNVLVKALYLIANICALSFTNSLLNDDFVSYGSKWMAWSEMSNAQAYNYLGIRDVIKPGEKLLPVFGFCDVLESSLDVKHTLENEFSLLCEISQHVLYHYVLIAIWVLIVVGFILSIIGLIWIVMKYVLRARVFANEETAAKEVYRTLSVREAEYLDLARKKNVPLYGSIIRHLHKQRHRNVDPDIAKPNTPFMRDSEF